MSGFTVSFHILIAKTTLKERNFYLCNLLERFYHEGKKAFVVANLDMAREIDQQLWTFRDVGFVPHALVSDTKLADKASILIGTLGDLVNTEIEFIANLTDQALTSLTFSANLIELVCDLEEAKEISRKKVRAYRAAGMAIDYFKLL